MIHFTLVVIIVMQGAAPPPIQDVPIVQDEQPLPRDPKLIYMTCDRCEWENGYESMTSAKLGMATHTRWCKQGRGRKAKLFG